MKKFLDANFLLESKTAERLFHDFAKDMPVIDYHCHLPPEEIASDRQFDNLTQVWLYGDHYKWRAMRANGVDERFCTGTAADREKFQQWAATVPCTLRNPLYHWTHLELQRYFDVHEILNEKTAEGIYKECNAKLQTADYSVRNLLRKMNVKLVCTTDDPVDSLSFHRAIKADGYEISILPAFRPDAAMHIDDPVPFKAYLDKLEQAAGVSVNSYDDYLSALKNRHDFFAAHGCTVSDHGLEELYAEDYTEAEIKRIFEKVHSGKVPDDRERKKFKSAMLVNFAEWDWEKGWVQQYHLGALRNTNTRLMQRTGANAGFDSIGDFSHAAALAKFLDRLDRNNKLTRTILYNLNPRDNELMATMTGNFNDGSVAGKIQWGAAWWFLDQKDGMTRQLNALSNMGLLARFAGMLTDSRSFLSYPRHEYFRRILCNLFGSEIVKGELPDDMAWVGKIIQDICYTNTRNYFNWQHLEEY